MVTIAQLEENLHRAAVAVEVERHRDVQRPSAIEAAEKYHAKVKAELDAARAATEV